VKQISQTLDFQVRVFNRDYIEKNVFPSEDKSIPLILVLGQESAEKKKRIVVLEEKLTIKRNNQSDAREASKESDEKLNAHCKQQAIAIKKEIRKSQSRKYEDYE